MLECGSRIALSEGHTLELEHPCMASKSSVLLVEIRDEDLPKTRVAVESREELRGSEAVQTVDHTWKQVYIFDFRRVKAAVVHTEAH